MTFSIEDLNIDSIKNALINQILKYILIAQSII